MRLSLALLATLLPAVLAADPLADSAQKKLDLIGDEKAKPGSTIVLSSQEVNAWLHQKRLKAFPQGMRDERIDLGAGTVDGSAVADFSKLSKAKLNGLVAMLVEGERSLKISIRVESANGRCTVFLTRVELSGVPIEGTVLDFLIKNLLIPRYPDVKINQPFDLDYNIDRIEVQSSGVRITMKK